MKHQYRDGMPVALICISCDLIEVLVSDRTKLMLASLATMMMPYRLDFGPTVLVLAAMGSTNTWHGSNDQVILANQ